MHKLFSALIPCLIVLLSLLSCSKTDTESYCPTWRGFTYKTGSYPNYVQHAGYISGRPIELASGDSVHITAHQETRGRLIYTTDYYWTVCYDTLDTKDNDDLTDDIIVHVKDSYRQHTNYDGYVDGADDPVGRLLIPANAIPTSQKAGNKPDTITFVARYMYSGHGVIYETGNIVENTSFNGRIVPQSSSFDGGAAGNILFNVSD